MEDFMKNFKGKWYNIEKLDIIGSPAEFFKRIKHHLIKSSKAFVVTLYIGGSDKNSEHLFELLRFRKEKGLKTKIIIDQNRGEEEKTLVHITRLGLEEMFSFDDTVKIPLPPMLKQIMCVLHKKVYVFDDIVILTGANLSEKYFSETYDRYYEVKSPELASYLVYKHFNEFIPFEVIETNTKVMITDNDYDVLKYVYSNFQNPIIASPYPNLPNSYIDIIKDNKMIVSSPECNTFFDKPFIKSIITLISDILSKKIKLLFYYKEGFLCHIKGKLI
ncbi:CDP-diacylglycerol--glycerol-3-phosphate 3-phosphatidyltransferase [Dictyocoela muelleri]|nr:CDP-diacylglycerol--glycerol-3-phosphate 3-phosphatidyltransferase [Dictyocoela muelleri]